MCSQLPLMCQPSPSIPAACFAAPTFCSKNRKPTDLVFRCWVRIIASLRILSRRDYPLPPALGQARQASSRQLYAPTIAEWIIEFTLSRLPERLVGRKAEPP